MGEQKLKMHNYLIFLLVLKVKSLFIENVKKVTCHQDKTWLFQLIKVLSIILN